MKINNAMTIDQINDLNAKTAVKTIETIENVYFVGKVIDARTGEIIPVGADELFDMHILPNKSKYQADDYTVLL